MSAWELAGTSSTVKDSISNFFEIFAKRVVASASIYLVAEEESAAPRTKRLRRAASNDEPGTIPSSSTTPLRDEGPADTKYLTPFKYMQIEGHWLKCINKGICNRGTNFTVPAAVVNLNNTAEYDKRVSTRLLPRLLTTSVWYDMVKNVQ